MIHSHSQVNSFPSRKLKGSHTITVQSAVVEDHETEEDSGPNPDREKEAKSPAEEVHRTVRQSWQHRPVVRLYCPVHEHCRTIPEKEPQLLWLWQPRSPSESLPKGPGKNCKEDRFKLEGGDGKEGRPDLSDVGGCPTSYPRQSSPSIKTS